MDWDKFKHIIPHISVGEGVIDTVADWVCSNGYGSILVVCDKNTHRIAGERVISGLKAAGIKTEVFSYPEDEPLPDEHSAGRLLAALKPETDLILGVGSGTINDICTFVGSKAGCPSAIAGTAPSMDGYASLGSAMLFGGIKVTPPTQCPVAIFCDIDILKDAPMHMIMAGLGDMLGKITSLADWKLSHIITGEAIPEDIFAVMLEALDKVIAAAPMAVKREKKAIESITEGLILSGIAMSLYGDSRPASGTEHHLAHFWEMRMLIEGRKPALHGTKVGLATVLALAMWKRLAELNAENFDGMSGSAVTNNAYEQDIRRLYGVTADTILQTENPVYPLAHIREHWDEIMSIARSLPSPDEVAAMLTSSGMPMSPKSIGLSTDVLKDSIIYARDRKKTYTLLQLLGNLGLLEAASVHAGQYFSKDALTGVKCFVLDMDGTIYLGDRLFPYTHDFLEHLRKQGKDYVFFTNNSSQNAAYYLSKLHRMGIEINQDRFLMSTHVLLDYLSSVGAPRNVFVAGTRALKDDFAAAGYNLTEDKPGLVILGFDTDMDYGRLTKLCDFIRAGIPVYGVNTDYNCPVDGGFIPDCGSLAAAVHASTGIMPEFFGKPSRRALDYIMRKTGYRENELCFIGDRLYTDIAIADGTSARSVLVLSGETKRGDLAGSPHIPDLVSRDLRELQGVL